MPAHRRQTWPAMKREDWQAQQGRTAISLADARYQMRAFVYDMTKETAPQWFFRHASIARTVRMENGVVSMFAHVSTTRRSSSGASVSEPRVLRRSTPNVQVWRGRYRKECGGVTSAMRAIVDCPKRGCNILRPLQRSIWFASRIGWTRRHAPRLDTQHLNGSIVRLRQPDDGKGVRQWYRK